MKKTIKISLIVAIVATILVVALLFGGCQPVKAEDIDNPTKTATWFEKNAMPYVINFATVLSGFLVAIVPFVTALKGIKGNTGKLVKSNTAVLAENALIKAENSKYKGKIATMQDSVTRIEKMLGIAFLNEPHLVANGYAKQIAELLKEDDNENTEEAKEAKEADVNQG